MLGAFMITKSNLFFFFNVDKNPLDIECCLQSDT